MLPFNMRDAIIASVLTSSSHTIVLSVCLSATPGAKEHLVWQVGAPRLCRPSHHPACQRCRGLLLGGTVGTWQVLKLCSLLWTPVFLVGRQPHPPPSMESTLSNQHQRKLEMVAPFHWLLNGGMIVRLTSYSDLNFSALIFRVKMTYTIKFIILPHLSPPWYPKPLLYGGGKIAPFTNLLPGPWAWKRSLKCHDSKFSFTNKWHFKGAIVFN